MPLESEITGSPCMFRRNATDQSGSNRKPGQQLDDAIATSLIGFDRVRP